MAAVWVTVKVSVGATTAGPKFNTRALTARRPVLPPSMPAEIVDGALIDFDMAAPGRPLWDLAIAAEEWAPLHAPGARLTTPDSLDAVRRLGLLAGAYGLAPERAEELLDVVAEEKMHSTANVRARAAAGDPVWGAHVADSDFDARMDADDLWLAGIRPALVASIARAGVA